VAQLVKAPLQAGRLVPNGVIGIFHWHNPGCTITLGLIQPLTEKSTRNVSLGGVNVPGA
jgi:hypothetical protein